MQKLFNFTEENHDQLKVRDRENLRLIQNHEIRYLHVGER